MSTPETRLPRYRDKDEGVVHFSGPSIAVNSGLCGDNDFDEETDEPANCRACLAVVAFVLSKGRRNS